MSESPSLFLHLPAEIHQQIGSDLDIRVLSKLLQVNHSVSKLYQSLHTDNLSLAVGLKTNFYTTYIRPCPPHRSLAHHFRNINHDLMETDHKLNTGILFRLFERVPISISAAKLQKLLERNGAWNIWEELTALLCRLICDCTMLEEPVDFSEMLLARIQALGGKCELEMVKDVVLKERIQYLRLLQKRNRISEDLDNEKLAELLFYSLNQFEVQGKNTSSRYETFVFVVEELGADVNTTALRHLAEASNVTESSAREDLTRLFEKILDFFLQHSKIDLKTVNPEVVMLLVNGWHWSDSLWSTKLFAKAGMYLGPYGGTNSSEGHLIAMTWDPELLQIILDQGCDVDLTSEKGDSALLLIVLRIVHTCLSRLNPTSSHANSDEKEELRLDGNDYKHNELVRLLLDRGADPFLVGKDGLTPVTLAITIGGQGLIEDLIERDARREERYGSLTALEVHEKWLRNDKMWRALLPEGALSRAELEVWKSKKEGEFELGCSGHCRLLR